MDTKLQELPDRPSWLPPGTTAQYLATGLVNLVALSFGMAVGWPAVAGPLLTRELGYSVDLVAWSAALPPLASVPGALVFGRLAEARGRHPTLLLVAVLQAAGCALLLLQELGWGSSLSAAAMLAGRCLVGVANGGVLVVCPIYLGEVVQDSLRGALSSCLPLSINVGLVLMAALGVTSSLTLLSAVNGAVPLLFLALFPLLPETPVFLTRRGDEAGALRALCWLRDPGRCDVRADLSALRASARQEAEDGGGRMASARELLSTRGSRRALLIVLGLMVLQQGSGINAILSYTVYILELAGEAAGAAGRGAVVVTVAQLLGSVLACALVDRAGRLPLLYASFAVMSACIALLGARFCWPAALPAGLAVPSLAGFALAFGVGAGSLPFLVLVEVFAYRLQYLAGQVALVVLSGVAFLVTRYFLLLADALTYHVLFWVLAVMCVAGVPFTWLAVPETKGRPVDHIVAELEGFQLQQQDEL